jgi:hypothetical protein
MKRGHVNTAMGCGREGDLETHGEKPREDRGKDWTDKATSQGAPRIAGQHQKLGEARKGLLKLYAFLWKLTRQS